MYKIFTLLAITAVLLGSCKKEDKCPYAESGLSATTDERLYLQNYLAGASLAAIEHSSGVFYNISVAGTGSNPSICSNITVKYSGSLIPSGTVFDASTSGVNFTLGQLIVGWQKVLPVLKSGGKIILYIPPSLGYGPTNVRNAAGQIIIPGNSYLKFELELLNVQ